MSEHLSSSHFFQNLWTGFDRERPLPMSMWGGIGLVGCSNSSSSGVQQQLQFWGWCSGIFFINWCQHQWKLQELLKTKAMGVCSSGEGYWSHWWWKLVGITLFYFFPTGEAIAKRIWRGILWGMGMHEVLMALDAFTEAVVAVPRVWAHSLQQWCWCLGQRHPEIWG